VAPHIAAILAMRSRILVMDEPTAGLDYHNYMSFMDAILQLPGFEAILFITHDVDLAVIYANRVLMVADGSIVADGSPHDVLGDLKRLEKCRLVPTSLLSENLERWPRTQRFLWPTAATARPAEMNGRPAGWIGGIEERTRAPSRCGPDPMLSSAVRGRLAIGVILRAAPLGKVP